MNDVFSSPHLVLEWEIGSGGFGRKNFPVGIAVAESPVGSLKGDQA